MSAKHGLPQDPTPYQIRKMCERIRKTWDEHTERRRNTTLDDVPWELPRVRSYPEGEVAE